jgi:hypothetical protein
VQFCENCLEVLQESTSGHMRSASFHHA